LNRPGVATSALVDGPPRMEYRRLGAAEALPATALCAISFGAQRPGFAAASHGLGVQVNLRALVGTGLTELWHVDAKVDSGRDGAVHYARGGRYLAGRVEISGRAAGFQNLLSPSWPAATAIGRQDHSPLLQVYWLAGSEPGRPLENPRQMSAFHYPRQYGPAPPSFSRAMQAAGGLLISGTASVLGHASHHPDDLAGPLDEILRNLASLRQASGGAAGQVGRGTLLKVYLRHAATAGFVATYLRARLPAQVQFLVLGADICRRELLAEIDAAHLRPGA
jgi:hypothetical protein